MLLDDGFRNGQPEPAPAVGTARPRRIHLVESVEDMMQMLGRDART